MFSEVYRSFHVSWFLLVSHFGHMDIQSDMVFNDFELEQGQAYQVQLLKVQLVVGLLVIT